MAMRKDPLIYLNDILFSMTLIEEYIAEIPFSTFEQSNDIQDKVMRWLEILAEAAKKLPEDVRAEYQAVPWKSIIGLRNIITHNYDEVNLEEVWTIITKHLPQTKHQIEIIQNKFQNNRKALTYSPYTLSNSSQNTSTGLNYEDVGSPKNSDFNAFHILF